MVGPYLARAKRHGMLRGETSPTGEADAQTATMTATEESRMDIHEYLM